jgi:hypothetical protein
MRWAAASAAGAPALLAAEPRLATFEADVTPPLGSPLFTGPARSIVDPLGARGLVLLGNGRPLVIAVIDWCEIRNNSYDLWRSTLARAAGTSTERVLVSCVHQHDAPYTDAGAQRLLDPQNMVEKLCDPAFEAGAAKAVADALAGSLKRARRITHVGTGQAKVEQVASSRRFVQPDGKVSFSRTSATRDPAIRAMPEGLVDPWLKTLSFWNGSTPVAALSVYSTHPMSYYGKGEVSADFVGLARAARQKETPGVLQIYASGASGDTMAGRYNDGSPGNRPVLAGRIHRAMKEAWDNTSTAPVGRPSFRSSKLAFKPRVSAGFTAAEQKIKLADQALPWRTRFEAALGLSWLDRIGRPIDVPAIEIAGASVVLLPAESFVRYQLWAQEARPDRFVVTLGFGECAPGYIPTAAEVAEGYNDRYGWADFATCEAALKAAVRSALGAERA